MASPFSAVLRSNYAASVIEAPQIEQIITKHDQGIAQIDKEIARTLVTLNRLQHRRAGLVASRQAHRGLLSPIRRTPPELLAEIFVLCLPNDEFVGVDVSAAPLLLVQICSHWRKIALSTPRLWNSISVDIECDEIRAYTLDCRPFGRKHPIEAWLSRSGNLPLSIKIYIDYDLQPISADFFADFVFVDIFIPFSSRWSNLHLDLRQPPIERLVCNSSISTPNLETLTLDIQDDINRLALTQTAARLQKITVLGGFLAPSYLKLPWSQLTEFRSLSELEDDLEECLDFLQLCPNLTRLSLETIGDVSHVVSRPLVVMPRLSWLDLGSCTNPFRLLLDNLVVPSLREINFWAREQWCKSELLSLVYRSSSPLELLSIRSMEMVSADLDACFESIQTLREISVTISGVKRNYRREVNQLG
jgi:hypothetical protein